MTPSRPKLRGKKSPESPLRSLPTVRKEINGKVMYLLRLQTPNSLPGALSRSEALNLNQEVRLKVVADVGKTRVGGTLVKPNALTVWMKMDPSSWIEAFRRYSMENGCSMRSYREMLRGYGIKRDGLIKRHKLKHRVSICEA